MQPGFKWGSIEPRGDKCLIRWDDEPKPDGSRNQCSAVIYGTEQDAEVELAKKYVAIHGQRSSFFDSPVDRNTTWRLFWWLITVPSMSGLAEKTKSDYTRTWTVELEPRIGEDKVSLTNYRQVCRVIADISSSSVQRSAHRLWKKMCNQAIHEQILDTNPVDRTVPMKRHIKRRKGQLDAGEVIPFLAKTRGTRYLAYSTAIMIGGMRPEEAVALMSDHIARDGDYAVARIDSALTSVDGKKDYKGTKNLPSERDMYFAEPFATIMLDAAERADGPLFPGPSPQGSEPNETWFAHPDRMRRNWLEWCERHKVEYIRPMDMRTIFSDLSGEAGTPDSLVDLAMGHAGGDGTTRGRNYMTRTKKSMKLVADMLADYLMSERPCYQLFEL